MLFYHPEQLITCLRQLGMSQVSLTDKFKVELVAVPSSIIAGRLNGNTRPSLIPTERFCRATHDGA